MKKINFKKIINFKSVSLLSLVFVISFLFGQTTWASVGEALGSVVGGVLSIFINAIVQILILIVNVLMWVASYSDFIHAPAVEKGWIVVRDLCNMFFVVILLIIAFATILGQEEYGAKKMLPKLVMAAVMINFSKLICGLMIDVSNVVMLTFVNAFSAIGAGNMIEMLGISSTVKMVAGDPSAVASFTGIVSAYIFGLIYVVIATVVVAAMLGMLIVRIVMIWILIVLSPFAFFLQAVPGKGKSYAEKWWVMWTENMLVGPIIAFFLWLSFAALQNGNPIGAPTSSVELNSFTSATSEAATPAAFAKFVIAIGMLLAGMKIAKEVGGEAGSTMGKIFSKGTGMAKAAGLGALALGGKAAGRATLGVAGKGINLIPTRKDENGKLTNKGGNALGNFALGWRSDLQDSAKKQRKEAAAKYLKKMGIGEKGSETGLELQKTKGFQAVTSTIKGASAGFVTGGFAGAGIGAGVGLAGFFTRNKINKEVKNYENAKGSLNKAETDLNVARANKNKLEEIRGYKQTVDEFDNNKTEFDRLEALGAGKTGFANTATTAEKAEYARLKNIINDKKVIADYKKSDKYLSDNKITDSLSELDQKVLDADQDISDKEVKFTAQETIFNSLDSKKYDSDKKWQKRTDFLETFRNTKAAMSDQAKKKKAAKDWVEIASNDQDLLKNINKPSEIYSSSGLSETWKKRFEELNSTDSKSVKAVDNMVSEIEDNQNPVNDKKLEAMAKALAAFMKKDGKVDPATLGRIKTALAGKGFIAESFTDKVSTQYKQLGSYVEDVIDGSGSLQYDAFAKNSAKSPTDRNSAKDIMGASFEKINNKAKELGVDYKLDSAAGVNQKVDGAQLGNLSKIMSSLIDDEIKALQGVGDEVSANKISQLNIAKSRLASGKLSGMSLKNTDVIYKGETDSERRRSEYNTTQHEIMHQYGAKNEEVVDASAAALQESKLIGRIPQSDSEHAGQRYDEVIGKMIADMENKNLDSATIQSAIASQIEKWQVPNAQRVIETEKGERDTVKDVIPQINETAVKELESSIDSLTKNLEKAEFNGKTATQMSIQDRNFFLRSFNNLRKTVAQGDERISGKLKPLSALAINEKEADTEY